MQPYALAFKIHGQKCFYDETFSGVRPSLVFPAMFPHVMSFSAIAWGHIHFFKESSNECSFFHDCTVVYREKGESYL